MKFQDQIENDTTQDHDIIDVGVKMALDMGRSDAEAALLTSSLYSQTEKDKGDQTDKLPSPIPTKLENVFQFNSDESFGLEESDTPFTPGMLDSSEFKPSKSSNSLFIYIFQLQKRLKPTQFVKRSWMSSKLSKESTLRERLVQKL